jgi:hypothetical protein
MSDERYYIRPLVQKLLEQYETSTELYKNPKKNLQRKRINKYKRKQDQQATFRGLYAAYPSIEPNYRNITYESLIKL